MALYKVYESDVIEYLPQPIGGWTSFSYNDTILAGDYLESITLGVGTMFAIWGARKDINETPDSHTTVYALYALATVYHPSWKLVMAAYDGQTGQRFWVDREVYGFNLIGMTTRSNFWQDTDDASWSHSAYGYTMRHPVRTEDENNRGGATGLPHFMFWDIKIQDSEWLKSDGGTYDIGDQWNTNVLAVLPKENRALMVRHSNNRVLSVHDYTTKRELFQIPVTFQLKRAIVVDNEIVYAVSSSGLINIINYRTGLHGGILPVGSVFSPGRWPGVGYDPVYRRILAFRSIPDEAGTGASLSYIEGYKMQEVAGYLVDPIPLKAPRDGRVVPVYSKVVGQSAKGVPGLSVRAVITGTNAINPEFVTSDATGKVIYQWDTAVSGTDIDQIDLSVEFDTELPGLSVPPADPFKGVPPTNVDVESLFTPGWFLYQPVSGATPESKWDAYLTGFTDPNEMPFIGVLQEYKWTDFENASQGVFDFTKITDDLAYLSNLGMKLIVSIKLTSESDADVWIPDYILNDVTTSPPLYPQSLDLISFATGRGIFHLANTNASGQGFCPILWDEAVHSRLRAVFTSMNTLFGADSDLVGYAIGDERWNRTDVQDTDLVLPETYLEARLRMLNHLDGITSKLIWEFGTHNSWSHLSNAARAGYNIAPATLHMDSEIPGDARWALRLSDSDAVAQGFIVDVDADNRSENLLCTSGTPETNALQKAFGDSLTSQCEMKPMDPYRPYYVFWYPDAAKWSGTDGILEVCQTIQLSRAKAYYGT